MANGKEKLEKIAEEMAQITEDFLAQFPPEERNKRVAEMRRIVNEKHPSASDDTDTNNRTSGYTRPIRVVAREGKAR